jgi:hypothetical protein
MPDQIQPTWVTAGLQDLGFHETGDNQGIESFIAQAKCGSVGDPWCAIWVNAKFEQSGIRGTRSASSQSFRHDPNFLQLDEPALGAIAVFWRGAPDSGLGHDGVQFKHYIERCRSEGKPIHPQVRRGEGRSTMSADGHRRHHSSDSRAPSEYP